MRKQKKRLAMSVDVARDQARYDAAVKRLLSDKNVLARILKGCVEEFAGYDVDYIRDCCIEEDPKVSEEYVDVDVGNADGEDNPVDIVGVKTKRKITENKNNIRNKRYRTENITGMANESVSIKEGTVVYDIIFTAKVPDTKDEIYVIINVEAQKNLNLGYPILKRSEYYTSRMISSQKNTVFRKSDYGKIRKVYSLWIVMEAGDKRENTITRFSMAEQNLVGSFKWKRQHYDLQTVIMICLGNYKEAESSLLKMLDILLADDINAAEKQRLLEEEADLPMMEEIEEVNEMCNLGEGIYERAYDKGYDKAYEDSKKELLERMIVSGKYKEDDISDLLEIPVDKVRLMVKNAGISLSK